MTAARALSIRLAEITIDCAQPQVVADFWAALLGGALHAPLPGWLRLGSVGDPTPALNFQPVPEPKVGKARIHLDLLVDDMEQAVDRVTSLGGRWLGERHDYDEGTVRVMADPEGNEFCMVQYVAAAPA
jgi:predicted enzyme related to lactoylglutathione lyase